MEYNLTRRDLEVFCIKILADAINNILIEDFKDRYVNENRQLDKLWLLSNDKNLPLSFLNVCSVLEINEPQRIRHIIIILSDSNKPKHIEQKKIIKRIIREIFEDIKCGE